MMSVSLRNIHNWLWRSQGYESYIIFWASGHYATCAAVQHPSKIFCMASFVPQPLTCVLWQQESCWQLSLSVFVITNKLHVGDKAYLVLLHPCLSSCWNSHEEHCLGRSSRPQQGCCHLVSRVHDTHWRCWKTIPLLFHTVSERLFPPCITKLGGKSCSQI